MISVIFTVRDAEEPLLRSLAALAPLATEGLIADVIVADLGSRDATLAVAEAAGCTLVENCANRTAALERAVKLARKDWLLALEAGDTPEPAVATSLRDHIAQTREGAAGARLSRSSARRRSMAARHAWPGLRCVRGRAFGPQSRLLVPRAGREASCWRAHGRWRGARSRARIEGAAMPSSRP